MKQKEGFFRAFFAPDSLRVQLLSRTLLILAVLLALIGLLQYVVMRDVVYRSKAESIRSQVMSLPPVAWQNEFNRPPSFFIPDIKLAFIDLQGNYTALSSGSDGAEPPRLDQQEYLDLLERRPGPGPDQKQEQDYQVIDVGGTEQLLVLQPINTGHGGASGIIQASTPTGQLKELLVRQLLTFLLLSLIAMVVGSLGFIPVLKRTLVPLFNMVDTAEQIDAGNLSRRFPTRQGQMEVDRLAESFNGMLERLEASFEAERETKEQMRRFIADASHELRTPLTSIHGFLEVLLRGAADQPDKLDKALASMHSESERLSKLVQDLILLAKLDRAPHIELKEGMLDTVIQEMEPQLRILAGGRRLSLSVESDLKCRYDADRIKQVVLNLFNNAVQHTDPENGHIHISLAAQDDGILLSVQDNGPGISDVHIPLVFDRFYRSDSSRTRKYGGAGLGLSITKSIVEAHGGTIRVESREKECTTFHVWLPKLTS